MSDTRREHAIVIGGSVAGLLAARALAGSYEHVTVIDRDAFPRGTDGRRSVPQGRHCHALIARGQEAFESLLPGITEEMIDAGAPTYAPYADARFEVAGHRLARAALGITAVTASRPFIEGHVRRRIRELSNVKLREGCEARGLVATPDRRRVTGVTIRRGEDESALPADLTLAATGRSAQVPAWLEALGYERPAESRLEIDVGYASRPYELPDGAVADRLTLIGPRPGRPRAFSLFAQEEGRWLLTLAGYGEQRPPTDVEGFETFMEDVAPPDLLRALRDGEPLGPIVSHGTPANLRRHYERLRRFPDGLLVAGDAICSFNPLYGQGMTVGAVEAEALSENLRRGERGLRRRQLRAASRIVDHAWQMAIEGDLALPEVGGKRPLSVRLGHTYTERVQANAESDGDMVAAFGRVALMLDRPSRLMSPSVALRALGLRRASPAWPGKPPPTPVRRRTLRVDGVSTPLREAGPPEEDQAVVFVHGVPGSGADFEPLLSSAGRQSRAVAWDAPGFGRARSPGGVDHSIRGHSEFLGRVLDELAIERAHLVLHDFGGPWGLAWAIDHPERVLSVTLLCAGVPIAYHWHTMARVWRTPGVGELSMAVLSRGTFRAVLRRGASRPLPRPFVDRMYEDLDTNTRSGILSLFRSVGDLDEVGRQWAAALRPRRIPALVVWGARDPYLPASMAERQREAFPDAEVQVLDDSGHWPFVDRADQVEQLLTDFIARATSDPGTRSDQGKEANRVLGVA